MASSRKPDSISSSSCYSLLKPGNLARGVRHTSARIANPPTCSGSHRPRQPPGSAKTRYPSPDFPAHRPAARERSGRPPTDDRLRVLRPSQPRERPGPSWYGGLRAARCRGDTNGSFSRRAPRPSRAGKRTSGQPGQVVRAGAKTDNEGFFSSRVPPVTSPPAGRPAPSLRNKCHTPRSSRVEQGDAPGQAAVPGDDNEGFFFRRVTPPTSHPRAAPGRRSARSPSRTARKGLGPCQAPARRQNHLPAS